jgi:hypothetical protein
MKLASLSTLMSRFVKFNKLDTPEKTNTYWFLAPCLGLDRNHLMDFNLVNAYLGDHTTQYQYENCIFLLFKSDKYNSKFNAYIESLEEHPYYVDTYDTVGDGNLMVVFEIPKEYYLVLQLFKLGKYSEFPEDYRERFFSKYDTLGGYTQRWKIFMKHEDLRVAQSKKIGIDLPPDAEVWSRPVPEEEIYKFNRHINYLW